MTSRITTLNMAQASLNKWEVWQSGYIDLRREIEMVNWCEQNLFQGGYYEPNWNYKYPTFYFSDEKEYLMFVLRWA